MVKLAPILLFVYNRPKHVRKTVDYLLKNEFAADSELFIFADGPKSTATEEQINSIQEVRQFIHTITGFKHITIEESTQNKGLANSIISGVSKIVNLYDRVIVLEDDMITSKYFLRYCNTSLDLYANDSTVACINGFSIITDARIKENTYFIEGADCWGWATWKRAWSFFNSDSQKLMQQIKTNKKIEKTFTFNHSYPYIEMLQDQIDGRIDSWAIRWYASAIIAGMLCLYPTKSLIQNIGFDTGTHCNDAMDCAEAKIKVDNTTSFFPRTRVRESRVMRRTLIHIYKKEFKQVSIWIIFKRKIKRSIGHILRIAR